MFQNFRKNASFRLAAALMFSLVLGVSGASAHDMWLNTSAPEKGVVLIDIGYGHDFPNPEPIPAERTHLFEKPHLVTPGGILDSAPLQDKENYAYQVEADLEKGSYLATLNYVPTFWSKGPGGWTQQNRQERPDATYVEEAIMYAKTILDVDGSNANDFICKPVGQRLEIVPLVHPSSVKPGEAFPLQVLLDGKPLKTVELVGTFEGFSNKEYKAFSGRTGLDGKIDFIPLKEGYWFTEVTHTYEHPDQEKADEVILVATLTFQINP